MANQSKRENFFERTVWVVFLVLGLIYIILALLGIITAINAYVVTGKLGFHELKKSAGVYAGITAALGFLAVGLILLHGFGWEVGRPVSGKYAMLLILLICSIGAALAGGTAIG